MLHNPSSSPRPSSQSLHPGKAPKSLQASPQSKTVANPDKLASAGKWCISEHSGGTKESGIPPGSLSQAPWLFLWLKPTFPRMALGNCFRLSECFRLWRISTERGQTVLTGSPGRKASLILARQDCCIFNRSFFFQEKCSGFSSLSAEHGW